MIRLTESDLHRIVKESVNRILNESDGGGINGRNARAYFNYDKYDEDPIGYYDSLSPEERTERFKGMEKAHDRQMARERAPRDPIGHSPYSSALDGDEIKSMHKDRLRNLRSLRNGR